MVVELAALQLAEQTQTWVHSIVMIQVFAGALSAKMAQKTFTNIPAGQSRVLKGLDLLCYVNEIDEIMWERLTLTILPATMSVRQFKVGIPLNTL